MRKGIICCICCLALLAGFSPSLSFAESPVPAAVLNDAIEKSETVQSLDDLKDLLQEDTAMILPTTAAKEMRSNIDPSLLIEYEAEKMNAAAAIINARDFDFTDVTLLPNGDTFASTEIDLGDGATLEISYSDALEPSLFSQVMTKMSPLFFDYAVADTLDSIKAIDMYQYYEGYKDYGNRYYTASYKLIYLFGYIKIITENHYTISDSGLTERYGKTTHDYWGYFDNVTDSWKITDSTAGSVGYDINILGTVTYDKTNEVLPNHGPVYLQLDTRVKLMELDKVNQRAKVSQYAYVLRSFTSI